MKKTTLYLLFVILIFSFCGCSISEDYVNLASESEILKYANKHYGKAECISVYEDNPHTTTYTLKDQQYGFEYAIKSTVGNEGMDGAIFWYKEVKISDYEFVLFNHFVQQEEIQEIARNTGILLENCYIYTNEDTDFEILEDSVVQIAQIILSQDNQNIYQEYMFFIQDINSEKYMGYYDCKTGQVKIN